MKASILLTTVPTRSVALKIARRILQARLAACVHIAPAGESHYWWKGRLEKARELVLIFKTTKKTLPALLRTLKQSHPYETPELLALHVNAGDPAYLRWLSEETTPRQIPVGG